MKALITFALLIFTPLLSAEPTLGDLQHRWALAYYQTSEAKVESVFTQLIQAAESSVAAHPGDADLLVWEGIIKSSYAGKTGGLGALGLVKEARSAFEAALKVDDSALRGAAYTSLGALYYQVPGWPIAFGDKDKARKLLRKGLILNPDGLDANYFYADFLFHQRDYAGARDALQRALQAPPRPGRELADQGRRKEAVALQEKIDRKLQG